MKRILLASVVAVAIVAIIAVFWKSGPAPSATKPDRTAINAVISKTDAVPSETPGEPAPEPSLYSVGGESGAVPPAPPAWTAGSRKAAGLLENEPSSPNATK